MLGYLFLYNEVSISMDFKWFFCVVLVSSFMGRLVFWLDCIMFLRISKVRLCLVLVELWLVDW